MQSFLSFRASETYILILSFGSLHKLHCNGYFFLLLSWSDLNASLYILSLLDKVFKQVVAESLLLIHKLEAGTSSAGKG